MDGNCKLCCQQDDLKKSHIIPKFIFNWLKETSATGKLRFGQEINKRVQDGLKLHWLCHNCEKKFSELERYFANKIFYPLLNDTNTVHYNDKLLKFAVSVSWRVLYYFIENAKMNHLGPELSKNANKALSHWRTFLLDETESPKKYEQHFYNFTGEIKNDTDSTKNLHRYLQRSVEIDVMSNNKNTAFVYIKLPGFLLIGYINLINSGKWRKTRICVNDGKIQPMNYDLPCELWDIVKEKSRKSNNLLNSISQSQKDKINNAYRKNPEKVIKSETIKSLVKDLNLFGKDIS